jgi:hypothetical protein
MTTVSDCQNCDNRKCMDCVLRIGHVMCVPDCPFCCFENPSVTLDDEVRNRVAAIIFNAYALRNLDESALEVAERAAAQALRELGIQVERGGFFEVGGGTSGWRLVTDWKSDDE